MIDFNTLLGLPRSAVFAIIDHEKRRVLVTYSTSLMASLARLVDRINSGEFCRTERSSVGAFSDSKNLELRILEEEGCRNRLMVRVGFYMREYRNLGYELLVERPPVEYRVSKDLRYISNTQGRTDSRFLVQVVLISKRNSKILVGEFKSHTEADAFISLNYSNGSVYDLKYDESIIRLSIQDSE